MPDNGEAAQQGDQQQEQGQQATQEQQASATGDEQLGEGGKKALEAERARAADFERQFKAAQKELEKARQASMSEAEKAIAEAEVKGRTAATAEFGKRLAKAALDTAAAKRNPGFDTGALEYLDMARFVGDDGEPDVKAIAAAVEKLVPESTGAASFDGGARQSAPRAGDMNDLLRRAAGRA